MAAPRLVLDVRPTAGQICKRDVVAAQEGDSLLAAFDTIRDRGFHSMPVLDAAERPAGMLSLYKLVDLILPKRESGAERKETRRVATTLARVAKTLAGSVSHGVDLEKEEEFLLIVAALRTEIFQERLRRHDPSKLIVVMGDRPTVQESAIDFGARAIVLTGGNGLSPALLEKAKAKGVAVLVSPSDTATTTLLIKCAQAIADATLTDFQSFPEGASVEQILSSLEPGSHQALFPVLREDGKLAGVFSKSDLVDVPRTRLVLVDHNEWSQAVQGAPEAEILEVIDHHRLGGGLSSRYPIRFINEPVGSTCTIVARMFRQAGLEPEPGVALALAAGIISDTLHLTGPTTTDVDREILPWLGKAAKADLARFAEGFFAAGSLLVNTPAPQAVRTDCKNYDEAGWKIAVAQIEEQGLDNFWKQRDALAEALEGVRAEGALDFACLLVTDIGTHNSVLLTTGRPEIVQAIDYPRLGADLFELNGIVSRKKELLPHLARTLQKVRRV